MSESDPGEQLRMACVFGNTDEVAALLASGVSPNDTNGHGTSAVGYAIGNLEILDLLFEAGADLDLRDQEGGYPLKSAAYSKDPAALRWLLAHGAKVVDVDELLEATRYNNAVETRLALQEHLGATTLMDAAKAGNLQIVLEKIAGGADVNAVDGDRTPLGAAAMAGSIEVMEALVEAGVDVTTSWSESALFSAMICQQPAAAIWLIDRGTPFENPEQRLSSEFVPSAVREAVAAHLGVVPEQKEDALSDAEQGAAARTFEALFAKLDHHGMVCVVDGGATKGMARAWVATLRRDRTDNPWGYCFTTSQDMSRMKKHGVLLIGFGSFDADDDIKFRRAAQLVVDAVREAGFEVTWDGDLDCRIEVEVGTVKDSR